MTRRRMYVFERAYQDYGNRFVTFRDSLGPACLATWRWFWSGLGAELIERTLRLLVVVSSVGLAVLYVVYEARRGRGFTPGTVLTFVLVAVCASILMWGWKAPVHFLTRLISGAVAASTVTLALAAALIAAAIVFFVYLLALVLATALSFLVFLPMRAAQELWLLYRRIAYVCPYDDCQFSGLPIHVCSCGTQYPDLLPSFFGIFYHKCGHRDGPHKLPTLDLLGRNRLFRLCGGCRRPLIHSSIGEVPVKPIAIVGGPSVGKTVYMRQATRELQRHLASMRGARAMIDSQDQDRQAQRDLHLLDRGEVVAKTAGQTAEALGLLVEVPPRLNRCLLHLYDAPGEHFAAIQLFGQKHVLSTLAGFVLLVDPFACPAVSAQGRRVADRVRPSPTCLSEVVGVLIAGVNQLILARPTDRCSIPVSVVLNKVDALRKIDMLPAGLMASNGHPPDAALQNAACRKFLEQLGEGRSVRALEQKFTAVRYFACSALGRLPDHRDRTPFQPIAVVNPLLWLLGLADNESRLPHSCDGRVPS